VIEIRGCLSVPLGIGPQRLGNLFLYSTVRGMSGDFAGRTSGFIETLAAQVADALERGFADRQAPRRCHSRCADRTSHAGEFSRFGQEHLIRGGGSVLALIDVADFKDVNDSLGHEAGDALLKTVARGWERLRIPPALLARSGGGEFGSLFPEIPGHELGLAIDRLARDSPAWSRCSALPST